MTTVQGIGDEYDKKRIVKVCKKVRGVLSMLNCHINTWLTRVAFKKGKGTHGNCIIPPLHYITVLLYSVLTPHSLLNFIV